jgi:hypothetical protein
MDRIAVIVGKSNTLCARMMLLMCVLNMLMVLMCLFMLAACMITTRFFVMAILNTYDVDD